MAESPDLSMRHIANLIRCRLQCAPRVVQVNAITRHRDWHSQAPHGGGVSDGEEAGPFQQLVAAWWRALLRLTADSSAGQDGQCHAGVLNVESHTRSGETRDEVLERRAVGQGV